MTAEELLALAWKLAEWIGRLVGAHTGKVLGAIHDQTERLEKFVSDAITTAEADLATAVTSATGEITALLATIQADEGASAESTAAAAQIESLVGTLNAAVASAQSTTAAPAAAGGVAEPTIPVATTGP